MSSRDSKCKSLVLTSIAAVALLSMVAAPLITLQHIALAAASANMTTTAMGNMTTTGKMTNITGPPGSLLKLSQVPIDIPLKQGYVNGNPVFYINTDISDQKLAGLLTNTTGFKVNYAPLIAQAPGDAVAQFYVFKNGIKGNGTLGFQPTVEMHSLVTQTTVHYGR